MYTWKFCFVIRMLKISLRNISKKSYYFFWCFYHLTLLHLIFFITCRLGESIEVDIVPPLQIFGLSFCSGLFVSSGTIESSALASCRSSFLPSLVCFQKLRCKKKKPWAVRYVNIFMAYKPPPFIGDSRVWSLIYLKWSLSFV